MNEKAGRGNGGEFGRVYIIKLPSGELIAVKKIPSKGNQSFNTVKAEVKTLAKIRHKNIVRILGFCYSSDSIFLIYEYLEKRSLGDLIGRDEFQLPWNVRLNIAIGVAQGLAYLHKNYVPHLLHRNLKSKNVLLDDNFEPKLTDFAFDRIVGENSFKSSLQSSCYLAPEFGYTKKGTEQMDVYSFGVVLLELLTGCKAEEADSGEESVDVVKWVRRKININNGAFQVLDPKIYSSSTKEDIFGALDIALQCTCVMPEKRPAMYEVVRALESLGSNNFPLPNLQLPS